MYLKRLEIQGFKSFAKKTTLDFLGPKDTRQSLTVVVGPNGSGKSNISDAIRWVMGEQSMKHLRGKKASDIIFSGSESKGAMSAASVFMTLDNADGRMDIEYDEVVVGRKIYRSGESEYLINGHSVRLLDLQLLLAKAQFGQGSYAVIGQGMIDRLLLQSHQERKNFFDEASGIKEFQIKRHQASLRLGRTKEHIEQAELVLHEISPRLKSLSRQVKKLEQRQEVELSLREAQEQYYITLWQHHQKQIDGCKEDIRTINTTLSSGQKKLHTVQQELAALAQAQSRQDAFQKLQKTYQDIIQKKNALEQKRAILQGRLQTEYSKSGNHQMGWLETKIAELQKQQKDISDTLQKEQKDQQKIKDAIVLLQKKQEELTIAKTTQRSEIASLESKLLQLKSEESAFHIAGFRAVQAVLEARHMIGNVHGVVAQLGEVEEKFLLALDTAAGGRLASVVVENEQDARASISYLREGRFGVATFLPLSKIKTREVPHFVEEFLGRSGVHGLAQDLVTCRSQFDSVFSFVFGSTLVVEDFDTAKKIGIGRVRMVTLAGDLFETTGEIKGGHRQKRQRGISFADGDAKMNAHAADSCEQDILEKQQVLSALEIDREKLITQLQEKESTVRVASHAIAMQEKQQNAIEEELAKLEQESALLTMSPEQYTKAMEDVTQQKEDIDSQILSSEKEAETARKAVDRFNEEEEQKKRRVFALQDEMQSQQKEVSDAISKKNESQVALAKLETKQEDLQQELYQELRTSIQVIIDRGITVVNIDTLEDVQKNIHKLKYTLSLIGGIDEEVMQEYEETKERHDGFSTQLTDLQKAMNDLEDLIEELDAIMKKKRDAVFKQIKKEFARYFTLLFDGGKADLIEIYGEEETAEQESEEGVQVLEDEAALEHKKKPSKKKRNILKGIDISASPPGKKIKHIQALSGGERTLTSIALMCAILKTNPSPFVVFDEVEASLDEANTVKVVSILQELAQESQFIIISHNKVTMHGADALYGVTMGNDGMSHLFSVKIDEASEQLVE